MSNLNYYHVLLSASLFPICFGVALAVGLYSSAAWRAGSPTPRAVRRLLEKTEAGRQAVRKSVSLFWVVLVLIHAYICSIIFSFYGCSKPLETGDGETERWLMIDYEIRCGSASYWAYKRVAGTAMLLYVIVAPGCLLASLKLNRIRGDGDAALDFFTQHVRPSAWYLTPPFSCYPG